MLGLVPRFAPLAALLAGLVVAVPSAAQVGSGRIAYGNEAGLFTINPDGSGRTALRTGTHSQPRWSPDGSRLAFTAFDGTQTRLFVTNPNGGDEHLVATGSIGLSRRPWSPDGARIAWAPFTEGDIYTANADGSDLRRLTTDGLRKETPEWSPDGSLLVYSSLVQQSRWELFVVGADGSGPTQLTDAGGQTATNSQPTWSPSGASIAFVRKIDNGERAIYVIRPDGTELHRVVEVYGYQTGEPQWSPDGTKIAFTTAVNTGYSRYGGQGQEVFVVNADGSGEQRLTELAPQLVADASPAWSPDGERMLFTRGQEPATMNPEGSCEQVLAADRAGAPSWQPVPGGPAIGPTSCRAIAVDADLTVYSDAAHVAILATITNEGTEPLTNVTLVVTPRNGLSLSTYRDYACATRPPTVVCTVARIEQGQTARLPVGGGARRVGRDQRSLDVALRARLQVSADGPLLPTSREVDEIRFTSHGCDTRDPGRGRIDGTRFPDRICGRRGPDRIHPLPGKDYVSAGDGNDVVFALDGNLDHITCGRGRDIVVADEKDRVANDCERVSRR